MTDDEIRTLLRSRVGELTVAEWCRRVGVMRSHTTKFFNGTGTPHPALLAVLGLGWEMVDVETGAIVSEDELRARLRPLVARSTVAGWSRDNGLHRSATRNLIDATRRPTAALARRLGTEWRIVVLPPRRRTVALRSGGQWRPHGVEAR